jgi:proteasome lid subunit RPN8/RPN11
MQLQVSRIQAHRDISCRGAHPLIMIYEKLLPEIMAHVNASPRKESCGLIVSYRRKLKFIPTRNVATLSTEFTIDPEELAEIEDKYKIQAVVHSHINVNPEPSQADLIEIERHNLPYLIVNYPLNTYTLTYPSGYVAPYEGRLFVSGITDCYAIWRDFYQRELSVQMEDYPRIYEWWHKGENLYMDNYQEAGMVEIDRKELKRGDIILMRIGSQVLNHCAVYLGDNRILQHLTGRLSSIDIYGGWYQKCAGMYLRHKSQF